MKKVTQKSIDTFKESSQKELDAFQDEINALTEQINLLAQKRAEIVNQRNIQAIRIDERIKVYTEQLGK